MRSPGSQERRTQEAAAYKEGSMCSVLDFAGF